jgi:hypothetical protein
MQYMYALLPKCHPQRITCLRQPPPTHPCLTSVALLPAAGNRYALPTPPPNHSAAVSAEPKDTPPRSGGCCGFSCTLSRHCMEAVYSLPFFPQAPCLFGAHDRARSLWGGGTVDIKTMSFSSPLTVSSDPLIPTRTDVIRLLKRQEKILERNNYGVFSYIISSMHCSH